MKSKIKVIYEETTESREELIKEFKELDYFETVKTISNIIDVYNLKIFLNKNPKG